MASALDEILQQRVQGMITPDQAAIETQKKSEADRIKAETEAALQERLRAVKSAAAQRGGGLDTGGYLGATGEEVLKAGLESNRLIAESNKSIDAETQRRLEAGIGQGLQLSAQEQAKQEADLNRKFATSERLSSQEYNSLSQDKQNEYNKNQTDVERIWKTGERTAAESNEAAQTVLNQAWTAGQTKAQNEYQSQLVNIQQAHDEAMQNARLAQSAGQFEESQAWEKEALRIQNEQQAYIQNKQIEAAQKQQQIELDYKKTLDGWYETTPTANESTLEYDPGTGTYKTVAGTGTHNVQVYHPGITELQRQADRAFTAGENAKGREIQLQIAQMQADAQRRQAEATEAAGEATGWGSTVGTLLGILL